MNDQKESTVADVLTEALLGCKNARSCVVALYMEDGTTMHYEIGSITERLGLIEGVRSTLLKRLEGDSWTDEDDDEPPRTTQT